MHKTTPGYSFLQQDGMAQVLQSLAQLQYPHSAVAPLGYKKMYKCTINFGFIYALGKQFGKSNQLRFILSMSTSTTSINKAESLFTVGCIN